MGQSAKSMTVVIAEADPDLINIITYALRPYSDNVQVARDGYEALMALEEIAPALMIVDLNLPELSKSNLLEHLRYSGLRAILTSSYSGRDIRDQLLPACTFVQKPFDLSRLRGAIDEQLARA